MDKNERFTCTPQSKQDFEMVQYLANLTETTFSYVVSKALNEWLKDNFIEEVDRFQKTQEIIKQ